MSKPEKLFTIDFEIFGNVQGPLIRKFVEEQANVLGIRGWYMNTSQGTIKGHLEGYSDKIAFMKSWLEKTANAKERIEKAVFTELKELKIPTCENFTMRPDEH